VGVIAETARHDRVAVASMPKNNVAPAPEPGLGFFFFFRHKKA